MTVKLQTLEERFTELQTLMAQPETASDPDLLQRYGREYSSLEHVVQTYQQLLVVRQQIAETEQMVDDGLDTEMKALAQEELDTPARQRDRPAQRCAGGLAAQGCDG